MSLEYWFMFPISVLIAALFLLPSDVLKGVLGVGLFAIATRFLRSPEPDDLATADKGIQAHQAKDPQTCITSTAGETFCYTVANRTEGRLLSGIGALLSVWFPPA